jgi:phosphosulfolactate phosphohydrolase-like enzyme
VLCCSEIDHALALKAELGDAAITAASGRRSESRAFDGGASPREFVEPRAETLILSTTNGTRSIVAAASSCDEVAIGALLNLDAVSAERQGKTRSSSAPATRACSRSTTPTVRGGSCSCSTPSARTRQSPRRSIAERFPQAIDGINARTYGPPGLEEDIAWCAQVSLHDIVPQLLENGRGRPRKVVL